MRLNEFVEGLKTKMAGQLDAVSSSDPARELTDKISIASSIVRELKQFIIGYTFESLGEEKHFFRDTKPYFVSRLIYYKRKQALLTFAVMPSHSDLHHYYQKALQEIDNFLVQHQELYFYLITNQTHHDNAFFTRLHDTYHITDINNRFFSQKDEIVSTLQAHLLLKPEVIALMKELAGSADESISKLHWSASKTDLIELIYALHAAKVFAEDTDIKQVVATFEHLFRCSLGQYARTFLEIRQRKKGQTKFLDEMKQHLLARMTALEA